MANVRNKIAGKRTKLAKISKVKRDHPGLGDQYSEGSFLRIETDMVTPDPNQPRKFFDSEALSGLAQSIKQNGILQPVLVRRDLNAKVWLVAGERRYRAAKEAGIGVIPAIVTTGDPVEIALIENIQRENLKPVEEAEALARLMDNHKYRQEDLAKVIGKARSTVAETLSLVRLPKEIKEECRRADNYSRRLLVEIAKQDTFENMKSLFEKVKERNLDGEALRKITRKKGSGQKKSTYVQSAIHKTRSLSKQLCKICMDDLEEVEKNTLVQDLKQLNEVLCKIIKSEAIL